MSLSQHGCTQKPGHEWGCFCHATFLSMLRPAWQKKYGSPYMDIVTPVHHWRRLPHPSDGDDCLGAPDAVSCCIERNFSKMHADPMSQRCQTTQGWTGCRPDYLSQDRCFSSRGSSYKAISAKQHAFELIAIWFSESPGTLWPSG